MPTVRRLGNADDVAFKTGLGGVDALAYGTIAILFRPSEDTVFRWLVKLYDSAGADLGGIGLLSDGTTFWKGAGPYATEGPVVTYGDWHLLIARKNTGDVRPRFSLQNVTTDIWVHDDGAETQLDWAPPTGGSIRTKDATSGDGPGSDYAAAAIWSNELPWAADTFGDAAIEAAQLEDHLDFWRDADPASGWAFDGSNVNVNVEDFTLNRADETSSGVGSAVSATDLDFVFETAGILSLSRNFLRTTQTEPGTGGIVRDLSETQGTPTTLGSGSVSGGFVEVLRWHRVVGTTVGSDAISTQVDVSAVSAATLEYRWRVQRYNSAGVLQASSTSYSAGHNTVGIKTATFVLSTTWEADDRLALSLELRKASGGGSRSITLNVNDADAWLEFEIAEIPAITGGLAVTEAGDIPAGSGTATAPPVTGTLSITEAADTLAAAGTSQGLSFTGTLAVTEAADTLASSGDVTAPSVTGTLAATEQPDTLAAAGTAIPPPITGTLAVTEAADTLAASGASTAPGITGTLSVVEATDTLAASGTVEAGAITGTVAVTEIADTLAASGLVQVPIVGTLSITEAADALVAAGTAIPPPINGTINITQAADTLASSGFFAPLGGTSFNAISAAVVAAGRGSTSTVMAVRTSTATVSEG
jgi:hypothetical protein